MLEPSLAGLVPTDSALDRAVRHILFADAKRARASLALVAMEAAGGDPRQALAVAVAFELLHTASLIHDDIMDSARIRRRRPCVHRVFGVPLAITAGDALIFAAYDSIHELLARQPAAAMHVLQIFTRAASRTCRGQALDVTAQGRRTTMAQYLRIARAKTGSMIEAPLESAAVLANAPPAWRHRLRAYGRWLGMAFQIVDDAMDCLGSEEHAGKTLGNDLRRGGATALLIYSLDVVDPTRHDATDVASREHPESAARWRAMFHDLGAVAFTQRLCVRYSERAIRALDGIDPTPARGDLAAIADIVADWAGARDVAKSDARAVRVTSR